MTPSPLRIATRGSPLALVQARAVQGALLAAHGAAALGGTPELVIIKTSGDAITDRPLREIGGKGLFTREIEAALLRGEADLAVHSAKDMPTLSRPGLMLGAVLPREDVRDCLISQTGWTLESLPKGARVGTTSLRRQAQLKRARPDLAVADLRGNVGTRLKTLEAGAFDAILLASAGLKRLGLAPAGLVTLAIETMLPAVGQGAIGIEIGADDTRMQRLLAPINHAPSFTAVEAERAFLAVLGGSCRSPIGGHAALTGGETVLMRGLVLAPDGREAYGAHLSGPAAQAVPIAQAVAEDIRAKAPDAFLDAYLDGDEP
jgi:hydroxymethylbilane synthase